MRVAFFLLIGFWGLAACGRLEEKFGRSGTTTVYFRQEGGAGAATLVRGLFVYAQEINTKYTASLMLADETDTAEKSLVLPNGAYRLFALGWDGASPFTLTGSGLRCARRPESNPLFLNGQSVSLSLSMTNSACEFVNSAGSLLYPPDMSGSAFSLGGPPGGLKPASLSFCATSAYTGAAGSGFSCTTATSTYAGTYAKVGLVSYRGYRGSVTELGDSQTLWSGCSFVNAGSVSLNHFPLGNTNDVDAGIFRAKMKLYSDSGCATTPLLELTFPEGMGRSGSSMPMLIYGPGASNANLLLNAGS